MTVVTRIPLAFSNAYLIQGRKAILVDSGAQHEERKILRVLAKMGVQPKDISLIVHTHAHFDHAGSTRELNASWLPLPLSTKRTRPCLRADE